MYTPLGDLEICDMIHLGIIPMRWQHKNSWYFSHKLKVVKRSDIKWRFMSSLQSILLRLLSAILYYLTRHVNTNWNGGFLTKLTLSWPTRYFVRLPTSSRHLTMAIRVSKAGLGDLSKQTTLFRCNFHNV